jgi:hypothetical protein
MIRHDHIPHHHEAIALPDLLHDLQEQVAPACAAKPRLPVKTAASEKMQMIVAVIALEPLGMPSL